MKTESANKIYDSMLAELVDQPLQDAVGSVHWEQKSQEIIDSLSPEMMERLNALNNVAHLKNIVSRIKKRTKTREPDREQGELFVDADLSVWWPAADGGRIKTQHAERADVLIWREEQISNVRNVNRRFDVDEDRRTIILQTLGNEPGVTVGDVWEQIKSA